MSVARTSRTGKTYYLHEKQTRTGRTTWFFSQKPDGRLADALRGLKRYAETLDRVRGKLAAERSVVRDAAQWCRRVR